MPDTYRTVTAPAEAVFREKMSKFIASIHPVDSAEQAREIIAAHQRRYHDARHVCWAYMIGAARTDFLSTDNGEPSGTAGKPILGQINSAGLTNVVIIVVRYFGGIKLGTSGLIAAYREAARLAVGAACIVECHEMENVSFTFPYMSMNDVMRIAKSPGITVVSQQFDNSCSMTLTTRSDDAAALRARLNGIDGVTLSENTAQ